MPPHEATNVMPLEARLAAAKMASLLEYNSDEDHGDTYTEGGPCDSPEPVNCTRLRRSSIGGFSVSSADEESIAWAGADAGGELDSVTLLKRLGDNPTETEMAQVASTRAKESIHDCFSVGGVGTIDRASFAAIPIYTRDQLLLGQHLGKGSFSDVFGVIVTLRNQKTVGVPELPQDHASSLTTSNDADGRRRPSQRRHSMSSSICVGSMQRPHARQGNRLNLAMKCLRPQARSNFEHFLVGVEDLIHETAILSSLDHPNIIKLWGRAGDESSFKLSDGYFILIDRLKHTLQDRIDMWAKDFPNARKNPPSLSQIKVARDLSNGLSYLHMNDIVFRDLKPANVGFDESGTLKLFDFGFATRVAPAASGSEQPQLLHDTCGTLRYMAPEVGLNLGHGKEVDVYAFGIVLWEICALKKPFSIAKSTEDFKNRVFFKGERPKMGKYWPDDLKDLMQKCWSDVPGERPTMQYVKSILTATVLGMQSKPEKESSSLRGLAKSFILKRRASMS